MPKVSIVIPSQFKKSGDGYFIEKAISSIRNQSKQYDFQIIIGIDRGQEVPGAIQKLDVEIAEAGVKSLSASLNAAAKKITGDYVAFLEDDDWWTSLFLETAMAVLADADFVSSTQLEVTERGETVRINDFPTPSGWVMHRKVWDAVGRWNEELNVHQDNEWLGRLAGKCFRRVHLVEATAPLIPQLIVECRPWLKNILTNGGPAVSFQRHASPWPLVNRVVHSDSWMGRLEPDSAAFKESRRCFDIIQSEFGYIPW